MIVEDDPSVLACLEQVFSGLGYRVKTAQNGPTALAAIREQVPDILLTGLTLPGMSGFELLSVVSRDFPHVRAIAMSGALAGRGLPEGVPPDASCEKGSGIAALVRTVQSPFPGQHAPGDRPHPIWNQRSGQNSPGEEFVMMACPECCRTFPRAIGGTASMILDTSCIYCGSLILYAVAEPAHPSTLRNRISD